MDADALWAFTLDVYARPGVSAACIACQEEAGADVNILLFLLFQARRGRAVTALGPVDAAVRAWREQAVQPLRAVRRYLKPIPEAAAMREGVKAAELDAERLEQRLLAALDPEGAAMPPGPAARASLAAYAGFLGTALPGDAADVLAGLV